jgi:S-DNA-T family DNA segregation ATPase FtsK/SpoIIIE
MAEKKKSVKEDRRKRELLGVLIMALAVLLLLGIVSYRASDFPAGGGSGPVKNWLGLAGAFISHYFYIYTIGYASIIFPLIVFLLGWHLFAVTPLGSFVRAGGMLAGFGILFSTALALPQAVSEGGSSIGYRLSGLFGGFIAEHLNRYLGAAGSVIVLLTAFIALFMTATSWSFRDTALRIKESIQALVEGMRLQRDGEEEPEEEDFPDEEPVPPGRQRKPPVPAPVPAQPSIQKPEIRTGDDHRMPAASVKPEARVPQARETIPHAAQGEYLFPPVDMLRLPPAEERKIDKPALEAKAQFLEEKLKEFDILGQVVEIMPGPIITRFEVRPAPGVKVSRFIGIQDDLALVMQANRIRVAPVPGKAVVGVEIPNEKPSDVVLREIIESKAFRNSHSKLTVALGKTVEGVPYVTDLAQLPHLLVAGATGSGKSVCLNTIIASMLFRARPSEVKFVLIDPKKLELSLYKNLQHHHLTTQEGLNEPVVTTVDNAVAVLKSLEMEMDRRYRTLARAGVRNIEDFNRAIEGGKIPQTEESVPERKLPYVVLVIDELADLMVLGAREIEEPIARLAQMARAVGIHLILATQRPSVDVITGVIKANFPSRIAFQVAQKTDSRTILDRNGAEKLLGKGDMLFMHPREAEPVRLHGAFISTEEVQSLVRHIHGQPREDAWSLPGSGARGAAEQGVAGGERDELFREAARLCVRHQQGSASLLQRRLRIGYSRAGRLIDELESAGILGPFDGSKARIVLVEEDQVERILNMDAGMAASGEETEG